MRSLPWKPFSATHSKQRSATNLDSQRHESLEDSGNLPDPDIITQEIDSLVPNRSPFGLPVHAVRSRDLHCRRPPSRLAQFAEIANDLEK